MFTRKSIPALGLAIALGLPLAALAGGFWETTNDEAGSRIVSPRIGFGHMGSMHDGIAMHAGGMQDGSMIHRSGDLSTDRQYEFLGEEGGWQLRPMQYRLQDRRLAHVDDPVGHMDRLADTRPLTDQQRAAQQHSAGS